MKGATLSKDGKARITLKAEFRVELSEIAVAIAVRRHWFDEATPRFRHQALAMTRRELQRNGSTLWAQGEGVPEAIIKESRELAQKLFPEMKF